MQDYIVASPDDRYPIRGTFFGCWAAARETVVRKKVASSTESIFLLIGFLRCLSFLSPWERIEVRVAHSSVTALTLTLSRRERELEGTQSNIENRQSKII